VADDVGGEHDAGGRGPEVQVRAGVLGSETLRSERKQEKARKRNWRWEIKERKAAIDCEWLGMYEGENVLASRVSKLSYFHQQSTSLIGMFSSEKTCQN
jgi:hypothetical protein